MRVDVDDLKWIQFHRDSNEIMMKGWIQRLVNTRELEKTLQKDSCNCNDIPKNSFCVQ